MEDKARIKELEAIIHSYDDVLTDVYEFIGKEYSAALDEGYPVTSDVRPLWDRICKVLFNEKQS